MWPSSHGNIFDNRDVLSFEAANYNALVFLGLALLNLGQYKECEETYWKAIKENSQLPLAFQASPDGCILRIHLRISVPGSIQAV